MKTRRVGLTVPQSSTVLHDLKSQDGEATSSATIRIRMVTLTTNQYLMSAIYPPDQA